MTAPNATPSPTLFDQPAHDPSAASAQPAVSRPEIQDNSTNQELAAPEPADDSVQSEQAPELAAATDRKRLEDQLDALKRKESELRRALAIADHPELTDVVRAIAGRAFAISRVEAKLAQGLSKSELRRRDAIDKKLNTLREKRGELQAQIEALEAELGKINYERLNTYEDERKQALQELLVALASHEAALATAGLEASELVPDIVRWKPELEALAKSLSAGAPQAS